MITKLEINGFKTFENFKMTLSPLVVIAGANPATRKRSESNQKILCG